MNGTDITHMPIRKRLTSGMSHIPEDRHKHGLVLDYSLEDNTAVCGLYSCLFFEYFYYPGVIAYSGDSPLKVCAPLPEYVCRSQDKVQTFVRHFGNC